MLRSFLHRNNRIPRLKYALNAPLRSANSRVTRSHSDDLLLPPPYLVFLVTGGFGLGEFVNNGRLGVHSIKKILEKNGITLRDKANVLDFGCGCGRVMRHAAALGDYCFYGVDYNAKLVRWSRDNLPFARISQNSSMPPLEFEDSMFDFIYAISIFTHFNEEQHYAWMEELKRILKPGGYMYLTFHGFACMRGLSPEQVSVFEKGDLLIVSSEHAGKNECGAYHPEEFLRSKFTEGLEIVDYVPVGALDAAQDVCLLRR
jgi:SAM-dependent methyltransferase